MIIGILEADVLDEEVIQLYGSYTERFAALLGTAESKLVFQTYNVTQLHYPEHIEACDAYLITGSKFSVYEDIDWIPRLEQFVIDCVAQEKKLIGICFGHQLIAHALGGRVQKHSAGWGVGLANSDVTHMPPWLMPVQKQFSLLVNHQDQVTRLPSQAALVATNEFCPVAAYQVDGSIISFQGHPEFNREYLQYLLMQNRDNIGEQAYRQAIQSLNQDLDHDLVAQWIVNFIRD